MGSLPISVFGAGASGSGREARRCAILPNRLRRWAAAVDSQPLQRAKQASPIGERQPWREPGEFFGICRFAEENRDTAAIHGALHIEGGVADEPNLLAGRNAALRQGEMHGLTGRLVRRGIPCPDNAAEQPSPAEPLDFTAQYRAGLVADDPEK